MSTDSATDQYPAQQAVSHQVAAPAAGSDSATDGQPIPAEWIPELEAVTTLHLSLGAPVPLSEAPQPLHATHPWHRQTIAYLLDMLLDSRLAAGELSLPFRATSLQAALQNGIALSVRLAYDCTPFTSEAGTGYTCRHAPGHLILHTREGQEVRVANPRMAAWLMGGWTADIPVGSVPDMDKETALEVARKIDLKAPWSGTFYAEYPVEGKAATEVRRAWVMEAEYPNGSKTRLVIDAQTGAVLRIGRLESLE